MKRPLAAVALATALAAAVLHAQTPAVPSSFSLPGPDAAATLDALVRGMALQARPALQAALTRERADLGVRVVYTGPYQGPGTAELVARIDARIRTAVWVPGLRRLERMDLGSDVTTAVRAARRDGIDVLLFLRVEFNHAANTMALRGELVRADQGPWIAALETPDASVTSLAGLFANARVDAEVRALVGSPARWPAVPSVTPRRVDTPFASTLALCAVDLDHDGVDELAVLTSDRLRFARQSGASLGFISELPLPSARTVVSLRQPLGSVSFDPERNRVLARTSVMSTLAQISLGASLTAVSVANADLYPAPGMGCVGLAPGSHGVAAVYPRCESEARRSVVGTLAAVPVSVVRPDAHGVRHTITARADGTGGGEVSIDGQVAGTLTDVAPPLMLEDLDDDGRVELFCASASAPGAPDRMRVWSVEPGRLDPRASLPFEGPVEAIAAADLDGDGARELVIATHDPVRRASTLWILP